jgi:hypothetical protein
MSDQLLLATPATAAPLLSSLGNMTSKLTLLARHADGRAEVEALSSREFKHKHQAEIQYFLPQLLSLRCAGTLTAAVGLQAATQGPLFLEQYLPQPLEQLLSEQSGLQVKRGQILEIGNLVSARAGSSLLLMVALSELIAASRFRWVTFTATSEVQSLLTKLHYQPIRLAAASADKLPHPQSWGAYYQKQPQVMAGLALPAITSAWHLPRYQLLQQLLAPQLAELQPAFARIAESDYV